MIVAQGPSEGREEKCMKTRKTMTVDQYTQGNISVQAKNPFLGDGAR